MMKLLLVVLGVGAIIGLMAPSGPAARPAPVAATVAAAETVGEPARDTLIEKRGDGHFYVNAKVNGQLVEFVVDTGATMVALTVEDARRIGIPVSPDRFTVIGEGASGPVRGQSIEIASVAVDGKSVTNVRGAVLEGSTMSLLGQSYLSRIGSVRMSGDHMTLR